MNLLSKHYHAQCFFFEFSFLLIIDYLRLRIGWLKIEDWKMKMGQQMDEDGSTVGRRWSWRCVLSCDDQSLKMLDSKMGVLMSSVDIRKRRKYMFCAGNYCLEVLLEGLFEVLRQYHRYRLKANRNLDVVFPFQNAFYKIDFVLNIWAWW